jgi:hypothetical protein
MFHQLKIWQDLNSDEISTSNELFDLIDAGISSINLNGTNELIANVKLNYDPNKSLSSNSNFENKNIDQIIQTFTVNKIYLDDVLEFGKLVA